jgi:hypothetical protein
MKDDDGTFDFWNRLGAGKQRRDEGIEQVSRHNEPWIVLCQREVERFVATRDDFTGEDIRFHCGSAVGLPRHPNAWGALINTLIRRKIIVATGEYRPMRDEVSHARQTPVYTNANHE